MNRQSSFVLTEALVALSISMLAICFLCDLQSKQVQQITSLKNTIQYQRARLEKKYYCEKNRQKSFTILETIISLGILALIILIIQFAIQYIKSEKQTTNVINFQRMLLQLEDPSRSYRWAQTKEGKIYLLTSEKNNQRINFRLKNHVLQLTTSDGGTMPIVSQIEHFKLSLVREKICLSLYFYTGEHYESNLLLEKYKHEEK